MSGIISIVRDWGTSPAIVRITADDTLATVAGANYIADQASNIASKNSGGFEWVVGDMVLVSATDGDQFFEFDEDDFSTLIQLPGGNGEVTLPVVDGDFTVFDGTLGALKDAGYSASDDTKTKVVMAGSAVQIGYIAKFSDTEGTIDDTSGTAINAGNLQAGLSGTAGTLISYPGTAANGSLIVAGVNAGGAFNTTISNTTMGQSTVFTLPDPGAATARVLSAATATPFVSGNFPAASGTGGLVVDSGFGTNNIVRYASVAITAAEFNGMYAAPKLIVAAPGANTMIIVDRIELILTYGSAPFANGGNVTFQYDSTVHGAGLPATNTQAAGDYGQTASAVFLFNGVQGDTSGTEFAVIPFANGVNKGLYLSNITGAFTTGNSNFVCKVHYHLIATA